MTLYLRKLFNPLYSRIPTRLYTMAETKTKRVEEIYQKKTQLEHILLRPDTYIGSVEPITQTMWVLDPENKKMVFRNVNFVPGLFKIFDEILVNAADNKIRDPSMDTIKVDIDKTNGTISIYNNGKGIPVVVHATEKVYVPELIFGHLLTSSNYDDEEKKMTGGRNGYGAKLCNIFSTEFTVETADSTNKKKFKQVFRNNMSIKSDPQVTSFSSSSEYTRITFRPDFPKFHMTEIDSDLYALLSKRVYDLAGCVKNVRVYFNEEKIPARNFKQYTEMYLGSNEENSTRSAYFSDDRWEICVAPSEGQFQHVSFVNSICTYKGGTHLNHVTDQIVSSLVEHIKKKNKEASTIKPFQVKNHLWIFVNCLIENPSFDSQTKENMTLGVSSFGSKCTITDKFMKEIIRTGVTDHVLDWVRQKQDKELKKTDGHKSSRLSGIPKLDDANLAGTRQGSKCTLILTEGDSAKALAISGLSVVGRDYYGVFPLRGKLLNVREANHKQIMDNSEINQIKQILGLQHGKGYTTTETLRYGHIMIMTDQDHDGSHIKGLIINFLDHFWPSLLSIPGFLVEFITPIVKATKGKQEICFYTLPEYMAWKQANQDGKGYTIKYYKGLGTSTSMDAKKYFSAMNTHKKEFSPIEPQERLLIDMAFNKKKADERKDWLKTFRSDVHMDHSVSRICYSDFIHKELLLFSMADNIRSIPCVVDGLKPGLRKVLFACFKRKLQDEIKLAQLAGYISEHTAYHHGEASLCASIIGMAQDYVGSNNINLLVPSGQFGTRIQGGKDAASPRYIFTRLAPLTRIIFHPEDDPLLSYLNDDGQSIEPEWYVPIIPMLLVNGSEGIGTGWSCSIPPYSPKDLVKYLLCKLDDSKPDFKLRPWYRGFIGVIEEVGEGKFKIGGVWRKIDSETLEITELPVGTWTQTYKEYLEGLIEAGFIRDYKEHHTDTRVHFIVKMTKENMVAAETEGLEKKFKLATSMSMGNMVCFDEHMGIRKYSRVEDIVDDFYGVRLGHYQKRKEYLMGKLTMEWSKVDNQERFIQEIMDGKIVIQKKKRDEIIGELERRGYKMIDGDYDYLLGMQLWSLTMERVEKLMKEKKEKEEELNKLMKKTPKDLWRADLCTLQEQLNGMADYRTDLMKYISSSDLSSTTTLLLTVNTDQVIPKEPLVATLAQRVALMVQSKGEATAESVVVPITVKKAAKEPTTKKKPAPKMESDDDDLVFTGLKKRKAVILDEEDDVVKTKRGKKAVKYISSSDNDSDSVHSGLVDDEDYEEEMSDAE